MKHGDVDSATLSDLTAEQRENMVYRLDHKTGYGLGTIGATMRGEKGDLGVVEVFLSLGLGEEEARAEANGVLAFKLDAGSRAAREHLRRNSPFRGGRMDLTPQVEARFEGFRRRKSAPQGDGSATVRNEPREAILSKLSREVGTGDLYDYLRQMSEDGLPDRAVQLLQDHLDHRTYCRVVALFRIAVDVDNATGFRAEGASDA